MSVDDPAARQVVRRELDVDAVAGEDLDPVAPHLAGRVAEGLVAVVEEDLVHAVAEGLDDLPLELDLVFLACDLSSSMNSRAADESPRRGKLVSVLPDEDDVRRLRALLALAGLVFDLRVLGQGLEPVARDVREVHEEILTAVFRRDESVPLRVVEPLHGSGCHLIPPPLPLTNTHKEAERHRYTFYCLAKSSAAGPHLAEKRQMRPQSRQRRAPPTARARCRSRGRGP